MLTGIRIYTSDSVWRDILTDLNAVVMDAPDTADVNLDLLNLEMPITIMDLKTAIFDAADNTQIIENIFGRYVRLAGLQNKIVILLYKSGGMCAEQLKIALGYSPNAATHTVDTAIYQLRKTYGREFIKNVNGVYSIGKL